MFEISGGDISDLSDGDLRILVARLAVAELKDRGCPRSSVTAGGHQDAADGGIDVRVESPVDLADPDFVPRRHTGFQVKKPDMPPSAIRDEMRPKGSLRDAIRELADESGSYVIVSSQGSVADKALSDRRQAMRDALADLPCASQLHTDFYDRERLAIWVNEYPGTVVWVRCRIGRPLAGWSSIDNWSGGGNQNPKPYLSNDKDCLIDESSRGREHLPVMKGIQRLRTRLGRPKQCVRLIGLSGVGKTRLVQALFEKDVGEECLDSSLAVYTDYSEETVPTARDMARELIAKGQRAILIVDNCNPTTHSELARLCSDEGSEVSLITVEYDVRDDEPERTEVFRLQSASPELVSQWIKQEFLDISEVDRGKIAEFGGGNFRVARALAETLGQGETLGSLKSHELFERIFRQRNEPDGQLLQAAEDLSLLYSINGEDVSEEGELVRVGAVRGIGSHLLYEKLVAMRERGVVQARGRFRAILPQAIANPLAARALARIPIAHFDEVCRAMTPRMLKSLARRLGFLHDSPTASATVVRWLQSDGPLGDLMAMSALGMEIIRHLAPVAPEAVLVRLEAELDVSNNDHTPRRHDCIRLIKSIGYDARLFDRAVMLLARFVPEESGGRNNGSCDAFNECFHLWLSGTQALPQQRRALIRRLVASNDSHLRYCAYVAMRELFQSGHFTSLGGHDFGARSRDWGWEPELVRDTWAWYEEAIKLVVEVDTGASARVILANNLRSLWEYPGCQNAINRAVDVFMQTGGWNEGWLACRATLRFDGNKMTEEDRTNLTLLINRLKPADLLNQARAIVLDKMHGGGGWDFADGEDDGGDAIDAWKKADIMAVDIGRALADDVLVRAAFIPEMLSGQVQRAFECGRGLAEGAYDLNTMWFELVRAYEIAEPTTRNATVLGGFLFGAHQRDQNFTACVLEHGIHNASLLPVLPYLQARVGLDSEGIGRLRRAIAATNIAAQQFYTIANGSVSASPPEPLAQLLEDIAAMPDGAIVALDILHMHFFSQERKGERDQHPRLVSVGCHLLMHVELCRKGLGRDYAAHQVIEICLKGEEGREIAKGLCAQIRLAIESWQTSSHDLSFTLKALFQAQPFAALDAFLLPTRLNDIFRDDFGRERPLEKVDPAVLTEWASQEPHFRYPLLGGCLNLFSMQHDKENGISPLYLAMLEQSPDKRLFLGSLLNRLHPRSWGGSLADVLTRRRTSITTLAEHADEAIRANVAALLPELDLWIQRERARDRAVEESFE